MNYYIARKSDKAFDYKLYLIKDEAGKSYTWVFNYHNGFSLYGGPETSLQFPDGKVIRINCYIELDEDNIEYSIERIIKLMILK